MSTVIEISGLTKKYGSNKAVNDISFSVSKGEILGFLGPNGAGKSTTMNILTGYLSKTSGKVSVCGFDILDNPKEAKRKIGYLPEHPPIYNEMTPSEYLDFVYDLKGVKGTIEDKKEHIELVMSQVGISHMKSRLIRNLSKGYKQRVGLAGALIGNPEVLILDEPTVGLDPTQIIEIRNVIKKLGKERTVILSTHILQEVTALCDRVIIINKGRIVAEDTIENLSGGETNTYTLKIKGDRNRVNELVSNTDFIGTHIIGSQKEAGVVEVEVSSLDANDDIREKLFYLFKDEGMVILAFERRKSTLEDVFVRVTSEEIAVSEEDEENPLTFIEKVKGIFVKKEEAVFEEVPKASKEENEENEEKEAEVAVEEKEESGEEE